MPDRQGVQPRFNPRWGRVFRIQGTLQPGRSGLGFQARLCCRFGRLVGILQYILSHFAEGTEEGVSVV